MPISVLWGMHLNNAYILINSSQKQIDHNKYFLGALFSSLFVTFSIGLQVNNAQDNNVHSFTKDICKFSGK